MGASTFNADAHIERKELRVARSRISLALSAVGPRSPARWRSQGAPWRDRGPDATFSYIRLEHRVSADYPLRPVRAMADTALGGCRGVRPAVPQDRAAVDPAGEAAPGPAAPTAVLLVVDSNISSGLFARREAPIEDRGATLQAPRPS